MKDAKLLEMFGLRDENAIAQAEAKYGAYCRRVAMNILGDERDAEECVSDAMLSAWNSIPPAVPKNLGAYLAKLARNSALDALDARRAAKRGSGAAETALSELAELASLIGDPAEEAEKRELARAIGDFVNGLKPHKRRIFEARYVRFETVETIAAHTGRSKESVRVMLSRLRSQLKEYLVKRGFIV